jgi:hypothetical protein
MPTTAAWSENLMRKRSMMPERIFLTEMAKVGFRLIVPRHGYTWEYCHPTTGDQVYSVPYTERYSAALPRLREELVAAQQAIMDAVP